MELEVFDSTTDKTGKGFERWREANPDAFVINRRTRNSMMVHKASCIHFDFNKRVNLASNAKYCSPKREELEKWVAKEMRKKLSVCSTCL